MGTEIVRDFFYFIYLSYTSNITIRWSKNKEIVHNFRNYFNFEPDSFVFHEYMHNQAQFCIKSYTMNLGRRILFMNSREY